MVVANFNFFLRVNFQLSKRQVLKSLPFISRIGIENMSLKLIYINTREIIGIKNLPHPIFSISSVINFGIYNFSVNIDIIPVFAVGIVTSR